MTSLGVGWRRHASSPASWRDAIERDLPTARTTRRSFLKGSAAVAAGALVFPAPSICLAAPRAAGKLNAAVIGAGGMGGYAYGEARGENLVAICDVDKRKIGGCLKQTPNVPVFKDFREMLDKLHKQIDVVLVSTPDPVHFPAAMASMQLGKHVFVQKPLTHNIWQARTLRKAAAHHKVQTVMGNQGHTFDGIRRIREWYESGLAGEVKEINSWTNRPRAPWFVKPASIPPKPADVPPEVDWDLWLGPAAERPFSHEYMPERWRGWWDFGCASLGDIGCHTFDSPFWAMGLGMPAKIEVEMKQPAIKEYMPWGALTTYHFPARGGKPPVTLKWFEDAYPPPKPERWEGNFNPGEGGMAMIGSKETIYHDGMRPDSPKLLPDSHMNEMKKKLNELRRYPSVRGGPIRELFAAIKNEGPKPSSDFEYAAQLTEVVLLGALAQRTGTAIEWDAENMKVKGRPELDVLIKEPVRKGWAFGEELWKK